MGLSIVETIEHMRLPIRWFCVLGTLDREVEGRYFSILKGHGQKHHRPTSVDNCKTAPGAGSKAGSFQHECCRPDGKRNKDDKN